MQLQSRGQRQDRNTALTRVECDARSVGWDGIALSEVMRAVECDARVVRWDALAAGCDRLSRQQKEPSRR